MDFDMVCLIGSRPNLNDHGNSLSSFRMLEKEDSVHSTPDLIFVSRSMYDGMMVIEQNPFGCPPQAPLVTITLQYVHQAPKKYVNTEIQRVGLG